jgi:hypothetical protein
MSPKGDSPRVMFFMDIKHDGDNSAMQLCASMLRCADEDFVAGSRVLVQALVQAQSSRKPPGGVILVLCGTTGPDNLNFVSVVKAELHDGFETDPNGMHFVDNIFLSKGGSKLVKVGMFLECSRPQEEEDPRSADQFRVFYYDQYMRKSTTSGLAQYFYADFLGFRVSRNAKKLTCDFFLATRSFINGLDVPAEEKVELSTHLISYLTAADRSSIQVMEFTENIRPDLQDTYIAHMAKNNVSLQAVPKDLTLIEKRLKSRRISFSSKVSLNAPAENFDDLITILNTDADYTYVRIKGSVQAES